MLALVLGAAGCVVQDQRPMTPVVAQKATAEIPQDELLDVGVRMFDPNIPADPAEQEKRGIYPDVRKAESRYMPVLLRDTLESTGQWGQVRVLPAESSGSDVNIDAPHPRIGRQRAEARDQGDRRDRPHVAAQGLRRRRPTCAPTRTCR